MTTTWTRGRLATLLVGAAAAVALLACGGVGSGGTGASYTSGSVTGFGSVIVAGVRYDDSGAAVTDDDGTARTPAALRLGMVVDIESTPAGTPGSAVAQTVRYRSELVGPVGAIDTVNGVLSVLGQQVALLPGTVIDADSLPGGLADLAVGDVVEVYGQFDPAVPRIAATRLERPASVAAYKLRGPVAAVDATTHTFVIGGQTIDYAGLPSQAVALIGVGRFVRVTLQTAPSGGTWVALTLRAGGLQIEDREDATVEGRVSDYTSATRFSVNGVPVDAASARVTGGTVALGVELTVRGVVLGGTLVADEVVVGDDSVAPEIELHGGIESLDRGAQTFVVRGVTVVYGSATVFEGASAADLRVGRQVEVKGMLSADGTRVDATLVHIEL